MSNAKVLILRSRSVLSPPNRWTATAITEMPGSCYMRSEQFVQIIRPHLSAEIDVTTLGISRSRMPSKSLLNLIAGFDAVIMTKRVGYTQSREALEAIRATGVRLGIDHVDGHLDQLSTMDAFDFHIAASIEGARAMADTSRAVFHVAHHADPRVPAARPQDSIRTVYFGNPSHIFLPAEVRAAVAILPASHQREADRSVRRLSDFNLHYAIRPQHETTSPRQFRPFTKGFNAAAAGANVVAQRTAADAIHYLGADYPYFVDVADDEEIMGVMERARESRGSPEWLHGLGVMRHVRNEVSPSNIAAQFAHMVAAVL